MLMTSEGAGIDITHTIVLPRARTPAARERRCQPR